MAPRSKVIALPVRAVLGAVTLRRLDELAKDPQGPLPPFAGFRDEIVEALRGG